MVYRVTISSISGFRLFLGPSGAAVLLTGDNGFELYRITSIKQNQAVDYQYNSYQFIGETVAHKTTDTIRY
jgi:hypothetical protein